MPKILGLLTPEGQPANDIDKVMLLAWWAQELSKKHHTKRVVSRDANDSPDSSPKSTRSSSPDRFSSSPEQDALLSQNQPHDLQLRKTYFENKVLIAGIGRPTFPISDDALEALEVYVSGLQKKSREARRVLLDTQSSRLDGLSQRDRIAAVDAVSGYGDPKGDFLPRQKLAKALSRWYFQNDMGLSADDIIFTVGEVAGLHDIFKVINRDNPSGKIVTPFPFYSLYQGGDNQNNLHPVHVMDQPGYKLSAKALFDSLGRLSAANDVISAFLFCEPNNPLGTITDESEWKKIADILRQYPKAPIILDECYSTMVLNGGRCSSLLTLAPDLKDRLVVLRSATKAMSASGERMACAIVPNREMMARVVKENVAINGHAPRCTQEAFAAALVNYDHIEHQRSNQFYKQGVDLVVDRLKKMGADMPDSNYKVEGAFYVMADLSELIDSPICPEAKRALGSNHNGIIKTDNDIAYSLLFGDLIMIAAGSYFGMKPTFGYVRITASGGDAELNELMDRIENRLKEVRLDKIRRSIETIRNRLGFLEMQNSDRYPLLFERFIKLQQASDTRNKSPQARELKNYIKLLNELASDVRVEILKCSPKGKENAKKKIVDAYRFYKAKAKIAEISERCNKRYIQWISENFKAVPEVYAAMFRAPLEKRSQFPQFQQIRQQEIDAMADELQSDPNHPVHLLRTPKPPISN